MSTELTTTNNATFALAAIDADVMDAIQEELQGLGQIPFDTVKVPSGGGIMFELPGDDPENPDMTKELVGVILHHHPVNSYWADSYTGGNTPPDCASFDGVTGVMFETGEVTSCATCPRNQFGSGKDGVGKACKNAHRLYILREGEMLPTIFNIPPTGIKAFKEYIAKRIVLKGKRAHKVVTKITLKKAQNAGGIAYSAPVFGKVGDLAPEQASSLAPTIDMVKQMAAVQPTAENTSDFVEVTSDEALPL